jgi:hypothetical protein
MESSSSAAGTGSAGASSSASSSRTPTRKRKRKDNIVAAVKEDDTLDQMRARVKAARKKKHNVKTISGNVKRVAAIITWLVLHSLTQVLTPQSHHEHSVKVGSTSYWFNWSKLSLLGDHVCLFLSSKWRKLPNGTLIPESYDTLAKFRSSVAHFREKAYLEGITIDTAQLTVYEQKVGSYMSGMEKDEATLRQKGVLSSQKGGKAFTIELYRETCKESMHKASYKPDVALFNIMAFHTCGRCGNVGSMHLSHFVVTGDCMGVQFPVTKTAQAGTGEDILLHFFDSPHRPYESVNLAMAIHFMCLVSGPLNGRVFPSSTKPEKDFRRQFVKLFSENYLRTRYQLDFRLLVNHSWRKAALSYLSMGSGLKPSAPSTDYRAGHSQTWKEKTYYHYQEHGDFEIGRAFVGQCGTKDHMILPPHFEYEEDSEDLTYILACVHTCFPWCADWTEDSQDTPMKFKACLVRFLAAAVYHSRPTAANPGGWIQETLPDHPLLNKPLYTDAEMIPKLVKLLGNVHGNRFERQGVDPRDKASFLILMSPCVAFSCIAMMSSMYHTTFFDPFFAPIIYFLHIHYMH